MREDFIEEITKSIVHEIMRKKMTLKLAASLIEKVEDEARRMGIQVVIAVSDASAVPVAVHCMDGAYIGSFDIALNKTFTAIGFKMSTAELGVLSQPGGALYGIQNTNNGKVVILGGGDLLTVGGSVIGAIGVSGGTAHEDTVLAAYGKSLIEEVMSCL